MDHSVMLLSMSENISPNNMILSEIMLNFAISLETYNVV